MIQAQSSRNTFHVPCVEIMVRGLSIDCQVLRFQTANMSLFLQHIGNAPETLIHLAPTMVRPSHIIYAKPSNGAVTNAI